jgi:3-hydroxyisobutyrate dehydrogenase-like beta-hydroxyacid dehydrogenase
MVRSLVRPLERIGILGCGRMGSAIAGHLLDAGTQLAVFDPDQAACAPLAELGAAVGPDAAYVAERSDLVLIVVVDDEQTREAVTRCLLRARPGTVLALCASIRPDTCRELSMLGAERGVHVIDAALVRGERGAEEGRLALFCGGPAEVIDALRPAVAAFAPDVVRVGEVGAGQVAKSVNNILLWACIRADYEALRLGSALGVDPAALREAVLIGSGANRPLEEWGMHRLRWPKKDLEQALGLARGAGVELQFLAALPSLMDGLTVDDLAELG